MKINDFIMFKNGPNRWVGKIVHVGGKQEDGEWVEVYETEIIISNNTKKADIGDYVDLTDNDLSSNRTYTYGNRDIIKGIF